MGFLDKIFKKQPPAEEKKPASKIELDIGGIAGWLSESNKTKIDSFVREISELWQEMQKNISGLQASLKSLEKAQFEPQDKTYAAINMTKDAFVKKSRILSKIPKAAGSQYSEITKAHKELANIIAEVKEARIKEGYVIPRYFKKEAENLVASLKNIESLVFLINKKTSSEGKLLKDIEDISSKINDIRNLKEKLKVTEKSALEVALETNKLRASLESQKSESEKILSDKKWSDLIQTKQELEAIDAEMKKIKSGLNQDISSIRRPLKKILYDTEKTELTKDQKNILYSESEIDDIDLMCTTMSSIAGIVYKAGSNLKETDTNKLETLKAMLESGRLKTIREKTRTLMEQRGALENRRLSLVYIETVKKENMERLNEIEADILKSQKEAGKIEEDKENLSKEIGDKESALGKFILDSFGTEVVIKG